MKVSYQWLSEYVDLTDISPEDLAEKLTLSGIEVDIVEKRNKGVEKVVVGYVTKREKHPEADRLSVCQVDVGSEELQIVCGAENVAQGQKVPVAVVGAKLPGDFKIKRAKLRGIESQGMICSAKELGIEDRLLPKEIQEGILVLPDQTPVGEDVIPLLGLDDVILELDLTPNRSDCLSMIGVAYEVAAILNRDVKLPELTLNGEENPGEYSVKIEAKEACFDYAARIVRGVQIGPSPLWLQNLLISAGIRPINNIVDITNYVMLEYGQPLHAFDASKIPSREILVRFAKAGEQMVTLDGVERTLNEEMLLITDGMTPIAIAGVMGGENSEVTVETTDVLLESAYFKGISVRRTSKKLGLRSEASLRFEKGVDPNRVIPALNRAAELLTRFAGGEVVGDILRDSVEIDHDEKQFSLSPELVNRSLGTSFTLNEIVQIFKRLQFGVVEEGDNLIISVPSRRPDIQIEADLVEEVARLAGYEKIPTTLPVGADTPGGLTKSQKLRRSLKRLLTSLGYNQAITYSLVHPRLEKIMAPIGETGESIPLALPMSEEHSVLRTNLLPSLLEVASYNVNRNVEDIALFELGKVYLSDSLPLAKLPREEYWLSGLAMGHIQHPTWQQSGSNVDFYVVKGAVETILEQLGMEEQVRYVADTILGLHPGRGAWIDLVGMRIGYLGQLHPDLQKRFDLKETYLFQLNIEEILKWEREELSYQPLPRFPAIRRDLALVVDEHIEAAVLLEGIKKSAGKLLEKITIFDVYQGEHIAAGKKSIAFSLVYRNPERTLNDEEVQQIQEQLLKYLETEFHAEIRS